MWRAMILPGIKSFRCHLRWSVWKWILDRSMSTDISRTRNIGLVAHIDAGKTTTTERMLYYSGVSDHIGEVHHGDTVMDYMIQERERGITIQMAAATIRWMRNQYSINLIDTPGHVDFTFEVERSLSVLDGAVVILDASAGVQAQTIKVWQQTSRYRLPGIIYLNKMDKPNASVDRCLTAVERKLRREPLLLQKPLFDSNGTFSGVTDLIQQISLRFQDHKMSQMETKDIEPERERLIERLADLDEDFGDHVLSLESVSQVKPETIRNTVRTLTLQRKIAPVILGSSYRNVGVQPLLDAVCYYLPDPLENERSRELYEYYQNREKNLCALVFKIHHHQRLGLLCYLRIYSGSLTPGQAVYNPLRETAEKIVRIYRPFADNFREVSKSDPPVRIGDIVAVSGLTATVTGDTLVQQGAYQDKKELLFAGIEIPEPVYYCSLECDSISKMKVLEVALENLQREDPSLRVVHDRNSQQIIIQGMGQLHIEIIKDRIKREYGVDAETGPLQVSYKETVTGTGNATIEQSKSIGSAMNHAKITLSVAPKTIEDDDHRKERRPQTEDTPVVKIINTKEYNLTSELRPYQLKAIQNGVAKALQYGPLYSFPVTGVETALHWFETTAPRSTTAAYIANISCQCTLEAIRQASPVLMEPIMRVEIVTPESYVGTILSDLSTRRAIFGDAEDIERSNIENDSEDERYLLAYVPLAEMSDYCTVLRTITSGMASFDMRLHSYRRLDPETSAKVIRELSGIEE